MVYSKGGRVETDVTRPEDRRVSNDRREPEEEMVKFTDAMTACDNMFIAGMKIGIKAGESKGLIWGIIIGASGTALLWALALVFGG